MAPLNETGDVFLYSIKNTNIGEESDMTISSDDIQVGSKADLLSAINSL